MLLIIFGILEIIKCYFSQGLTWVESEIWSLKVRGLNWTRDESRGFYVANVPSVKIEIKIKTSGVLHE